MKKFERLESAIKIEFGDKELLRRAFTHRSYLNEAIENDMKSNERLEFLGDAVLQFLMSKYIFDRYKDFAEGQLTNLRSKIVNTTSLATEASKLNLGSYLLISKGERQTASESNYILADTFEALLGAVFIDKGISP